MNELEQTTVDLLSLSWEEIYGVLAKMNDATKSMPAQTKQLLISKPNFARALFQAQLELGIANLETEPEAVKPEDEDIQSVIQHVSTMTKEDYDNLPPETQMYVRHARESLHLPMWPE